MHVYVVHIGRLGLSPSLLWAPFRSLSLRYPSIFSLPTILHLGEVYSNLSRTPMNIWRNRHTISAKSKHDLNLSAPNEIDTQSQWNRHSISTWPTDEIGSFKTNRQHMYNWFPLISPDPNWVCRPLRQCSLNSNINCKISTLAQLSKQNATYMPSNTPPKRNTIWADQRTCVQLSNWMKHHSKWPQEEPNMSQHWLSNWLALQSKCL